MLPEAVVRPPKVTIPAQPTVDNKTALDMSGQFLWNPVFFWVHSSPGFAEAKLCLARSGWGGTTQSAQSTDRHTKNVGAVEFDHSPNIQGTRER